MLKIGYIGWSKLNLFRFCHDRLGLVLSSYIRLCSDDDERVFVEFGIATLS